ncbi:hypothetical protein OGATHE_004797 [Ogataea polymorpha]|uniref:Uncharacterized protein n=1 Tax=Ogataea polymorpha TaxID=460523 RepID=A0A9P8P1F6_9ASCO|nr:hypothetical protein OGATHE_004797 [Ogataea polymorpha]
MTCPWESKSGIVESLRASSCGYGISSFSARARFCLVCETLITSLNGFSGKLGRESDELLVDLNGSLAKPGFCSESLDKLSYASLKGRNSLVRDAGFSARSFALSLYSR